MRAKAKNDGLSVLAVAGTHVVLLGWDLDETTIRNDHVLGFAVQRRRHRDGEVLWMRGMKTFQATLADPAPGELVSSYEHPFQSFQWGDYSVSPGETYTYRIVARAGRPDSLFDGPGVDVTVTCERTDLGRHAVFFNRGAIASQEYARRFQNRKPNEVGKAAYDWLSRGLIEGLEAFIAQAESGDELYGAFFEFKNSRVYDALRAAKARGTVIKILYDGDSQRDGNEAALENSRIKKLAKPRLHSGQFAHNKFFVLRRSDKSEEVWTGSTNLSENGIFGHSNNAHIVRDGRVAEAFYQYWRLLSKDHTLKPTAAACTAATPAPPNGQDREITPVFSPRSNLDALDWYAALAGGAERALFATFAFGMNERLVKVYDQKDDVLRFALMEKKGNGRTLKQQAAEIDRIRKLPNVVVSVGNKVTLNKFDRWLAEIDKIVDEAHVLYVHTKYMLIDPLGPEPIVIVGSANFSKASTDTNDENMLVIRGNAAVADIYMGEFMRLFSHYAFRESLKFKDNLTPVAALKRKHLTPNPDWITGDGRGSGYFEQGTDRMLRRLYFSGR